MTALKTVARGLRRRLGGATATEHSGVPPELLAITDEDRRWLSRLYDDSLPVPAEVAEVLSPDSPRLAELRARYSNVDAPVTQASRWSPEAVRDFLDLRYFRGETLITWHYRELPRISRLKYFLYARYVAERDSLRLLDTLAEDGAFGSWTYSYAAHPLYSRDLLDSANEIGFLDRQLDLRSIEGLSVLDIGAGYGRLAHRMSEAGLVADYCCVDAVPESTFISETYLAYRGCAPPARVLPLDTFVADAPGSFDLAVNVHSWSECTEAAVCWWVDRVSELEIPRVLVVPNEPERLLTLEPDGSRRDFLPLLEGAGYELAVREPVIDDPAVRELMPLEDRFHLFERT